MMMTSHTTPGPAAGRLSGRGSACRCSVVVGSVPTWRLLCSASHVSESSPRLAPEPDEVLLPTTYHNTDGVINTPQSHCSSPWHHHRSRNLHTESKSRKTHFTPNTTRLQGRQLTVISSSFTQQQQGIVGQQYLLHCKKLSQFVFYWSLKCCFHKKLNPAALCVCVCAADRCRRARPGAAHVKSLEHVWFWLGVIVGSNSAGNWRRTQQLQDVTLWCLRSRTLALKKVHRLNWLWPSTRTNPEPAKNRSLNGL